MNEILEAVVFVTVGVGAMLLYYFGTDWLLSTVFADKLDANGRVERSFTNLRARVRPWLFVAPALLFLGVYLLYPSLATFYFSFFNSDGEEFINVDAIFSLEQGPEVEEGQNRIDTCLTILNTTFCLENYEWALGNDAFQQSVLNNVLWIVIVPVGSTAFGLLIAVLADRVRWESIAKSFIFLPMAISFVGASIIWNFVYDQNPAGQEQIGILNAVITSFGIEPIVFLNEQPWNNFFLMVILIWIQTGFAMVVLSAALKAVPEETLEASRIDGANEIQIFFRIMIPQIASTIAVVMTTILIASLKVFDIVYVMTNGQSDTEVLGNFFFRWLTRGLDDGKAAVIALSIMVALVPVLYWNVRRFIREEALR